MRDDPIEGFKALAHPLRFRILATLADGEHNVGEIEDASGIGQPALSQQLAILRKAQLVATRREAKQVYYALKQDELAVLRKAIEALTPSPKEVDLASTQLKKSGAAVFARLNI